MPEAAEMEIVAGNSGRGLPAGPEGEHGLDGGCCLGARARPALRRDERVQLVPDDRWSPTATIGSGSDGKGADVAAADGVLTVTFVPPSNGICTMDFVPTTTVVEAPAESDTGGPVPVMLGDKGKVQLQPRSADGEPGPIAWLDS